MCFPSYQIREGMIYCIACLWFGISWRGCFIPLLMRQNFEHRLRCQFKYQFMVDLLSFPFRQSIVSENLNPASFLSAPYVVLIVSQSDTRTYEISILSPPISFAFFKCLSITSTTSNLAPQSLAISIACLQSFLAKST